MSSLGEISSRLYEVYYPPSDFQIWWDNAPVFIRGLIRITIFPLWFPFWLIGKILSIIFGGIVNFICWVGRE